MEGDVSPRTRSRWAQSFSHTLNSPRARTRFRHFLESEVPRQPVHLDTLEFWEECTNLIVSSSISGSARRVAARQLAERVDSGDLMVNLDEGILQRVFLAHTTAAVKVALKEAMQAVATGDPDLLDAYREFINRLSQNPN